MSLIAIPTSAPQSRKWSLRIGAASLAVCVVALAWWIVRAYSAPATNGLGQFYAAVPMDMDVKINKDGELDAVNNIDIMCEVEGQNTITTIVPEGTFVKKGDTICTIDDSAIKQKIEDTTLDLQTADAALTTSQEMKDIQESQNSANMESAEVALTLAKLDLQEYTDGSYPQDVQNAETTQAMAKITLKNKEEHLAQTKALFGKGYVTATDVKTDELDLTTASNAVDQATSALKVLTEYTHPKDVATKQNALSQAEQGLVHTKREDAANLGQRVADFTAKTEADEVIKRKMEHLQEQLADCTIKAPADGMAVYASSGDRWAQNQIEEGATVRERQVLLRLPDTSSMKVVVRIGEGQVGRLVDGMRANVNVPGQSKMIGATLSRISVLIDNSQRWYNPDLKEYPVDLVLDETPKSLKPGMSANVDIQVDHLGDVLAVPVGAIYSAASEVYVFVHDGDKVKPVKVKVGETNATHIQILNGLESGTEVLLLSAGQGRQLLEKNGIKDEAPATRPSDDPAGRNPHISSPHAQAPTSAPASA